MKYATVESIVLAVTLVFGIAVFPALGDPEAEANESVEPITAKVGMAASLVQVVIPGTELEAKELSRDDALVVRIVASFPHGTDYRYDIECFALEAGEYNIVDALRRKDGSSVDVPPLMIKVVDSLPPGQVKPSALQPRNVAEGGRYRMLVAAAVVVWLIGLALILTWRRPKVSAEGKGQVKKVSFADRLRPLLDAARTGDLDVGKKAELERTLLTYWQRRLGLENVSPHDALQELRQHPEASQLLRQLEIWLHRPKSDANVDVELLLAPYQDVEEPGSDVNEALAAIESEGG